MANRREFLQTVAGISALATLPSTPSVSAANLEVADIPNHLNHISCNSYNWSTFYSREKKRWGEDLDACIAEFAKTGIKAFEPGLSTLEDAKKHLIAVKKHNIALPSVYINSTLHDAALVEKEINNVLSIADEVKPYGTKIIVTNPSPIKWNSTELKTDEQLAVQAAAMDKLGAALRSRGMVIAYHTHAPELLAGAREFHHVMLNTDPKNVSFCFDVHWVFRGSSDSKVAVFDVLKLYGKRVVELHVRQSVNGVWSETFGEGDIDYNRLVREMKAMKIRPLVVIEQCIEAKTPHTMTGFEAHIKDLAAFQTVFAPILG